MKDKIKNWLGLGTPEAEPELDFSDCDPVEIQVTKSEGKDNGVTLDHDGNEPFLVVHRDVAKSVGWLPRELINAHYHSVSELLILTPAKFRCVRAKMLGDDYLIPLRFREAPKEYLKRRVVIPYTIFGEAIIIDFRGYADG